MFNGERDSHYRIDHEVSGTHDSEKNQRFFYVEKNKIIVRFQLVPPKKIFKILHRAHKFRDISNFSGFFLILSDYIEKIPDYLSLNTLQRAESNSNS